MPIQFKPEYKLGQPVSFNNSTITPIALTWLCQLPGRAGGLIWNRPISVLVVHENGQEEIIPIPDITRRVIWAILGAGLGAVALISITNQVMHKTKRIKL